MKLTFAVVLIAAGALSGVPPLSGFWSKDSILSAAWNTNQYGLFAVGAITAGITAFYTFRMFGIIFYGDKSKHLQELEVQGAAEVGIATQIHQTTTSHQIDPSEKEVEHRGELLGHEPHEPSPLAWVPYSILGAMCVVIGIATPVFNLEKVLYSAATTYIDGLFPKVASSVVPPTSYNFEAMGISLAFVAVGLGSAWYLYIGRRASPRNFVGDTGVMHTLYTFLENRWYINAIYYKVFVNAPIKFAQWALDNVEDRVLSKINIGGVAVGVDLSQGGNALDKFVDAVATGFARVGQWFSRSARKMQSGILEQYALVFTIGLLILLIIFLITSGVKLP
jgi:NADH-quinone oxidoreductase subunit L